MSSEARTKTLGQVIDEIIGALKQLDASSRAVAIRAACEQLVVETPAVAPGGTGTVVITPPAPVGAGASQPPAGPAAARVKDIRTLTAEKQPASAVEMAAVVAHYLQALAPEGERKDTIATADLDKYFRQADFPLQKRLEQVLPNAKGAGYFDSAARAAYRLNPVGYNLVVHTLPRQAPGALAKRPRVSAGKRPQRHKNARRA